MEQITDKEFNMIRDYIKKNYGISLGDEKKSLIYSRLRFVLIEKGFENFTQYYDYLISDKTGEASLVFIDKITTNHTFFMREVEHFYYFRDTVLPYLEETVKDKDIRIWCAASSSGEEPYTLQMIMNDYFKGKSGWNHELLATDISSNVLVKAVKGIYTNEQIKPLDENWKKNYFKKYDNNSVTVCDEIKSKVTYRKFNLMETKLPFKKPFDVIFCRNVMIYFDTETRKALVERMYDASKEGAYLFIGHSESLNNIGTRYKYVMPATYRKITKE
ncbi:MAG: protein-glutamate O-methyltransferase CheR [Firmicutes bacterium]|nr:protein-glutamate O-methyltransferase CheR [Bacillota bacterium]